MNDSVQDMLNEQWRALSVELSEAEESRNKEHQDGVLGRMLELLRFQQELSHAKR